MKNKFKKYNHSNKIQINPKINRSKNKSKKFNKSKQNKNIKKIFKNKVIKLLIYKILKKNKYIKKKMIKKIKNGIGNIQKTTDIPGTRGATESLWRHPRAVLRSPATFRIR